MNSQKSLQIILGISTGFLLFYCLFHSEIFIYLSLAIGLVGLVSPLLSKYIALAWDRLGQMMGNFVSKLVLSLVFLIIIMQSILYRLFKHRGPLDLPESDTYYKIRNHEYTASDMEKLW
jgi:hypothetical protein